MKKTVAVIGCGRIAQNAHLPALTELDSVRIKYACDIDVKKAETVKEKFPKIESVIGDYNIAISDSEVDAVFVLTPNYSHYEITMAALEAGKHVFCEKPITVDYKLSCEMAEKAAQKGLILNIGVCNRFNKSIEMLREMNEKGEFGNIYHVYCSFRSFRSIPGLGGAFTTKSMSGGGVLIDWGVHFLDLILYILGDVKINTLTCDAYNEMAKDMQTYKYKNMWAEDTSDMKNGTNDVEDFITGHIRTTKASISFNGAWAQNIAEKDMFIDFLGDKCGARLSYQGKFTVYRGDTLETVAPEYDIPNQYLCEDSAFIESISTGEKNRQYIDNVLESAKLLDALYLSAKNKKEVSF